MPGPYTFDETVPKGDVHNIKDGATRIRETKSQTKLILVDWFNSWPANAHCLAGWPRVIVAATKSALPAVISPYGRLGYVTGTKHLYRETATGWVNAHPLTQERLVGTGLTGDGYLANPNMCGTQVFDFTSVSGSPRPTYRGVFVGQDFACSIDVAYRAFFRWSLVGAPSQEIAKVEFWAYLAEAITTSGNIGLRQISDFGTLDFGDYGIATLVDLGLFLGGEGAQPGWVTKDVTAQYLAAVGGNFALQLRGSNEAGVGRSAFWGFVAADDIVQPHLRPKLVITFTS